MYYKSNEEPLLSKFSFMSQFFFSQADAHSSKISIQDFIQYLVSNWDIKYRGPGFDVCDRLLSQERRIIQVLIQTFINSAVQLMFVFCRDSFC